MKPFPKWGYLSIFFMIPFFLFWLVWGLLIAALSLTFLIPWLVFIILILIPITTFCKIKNYTRPNWIEKLDKDRCYFDFWEDVLFAPMDIFERKI